MKTLGQHVSHDGCVVECFNKTLEQMWRSYYANICPGLLGSSQKAKFAFVQNSLMSIASWKWARWPYSKVLATRLDAAQGHFLQLLFPVPHMPNELADSFFSRLRVQSGKLVLKVGRWSSFWAGSIKSWASHLQRGDQDTYWPCMIFSFHGLSYLESRRRLYSRNRNSYTHTRDKQGHVQKRWHGIRGCARYCLACSQPSGQKSHFWE